MPPAPGHFPAHPSLGHGGPSPSAAGRQFFGSQGHKCPHVLCSPTLPWHQRPFGTGGAEAGGAEPPSNPTQISAWLWGAALGRSHLPAAQKADFSGDSTAATINHSLTLLQRLQELLQNGNGSDSVLRVRSAASDEPKVFHTHQLLLSLQSEVFESLLRNQSVVTLYEPPETAALFEKFIR